MKPLSDDSAFEEYLRGGSGLSRAYAALGDEQPAARVDEAVLRAARDTLHQPSAVDVAPTRRAAGRRWYVPLSAAAIVLLSFGLVLRMTTDPAGEISQDVAVDAAQPLPEASPRRLPAEARGEKARAFEAAGSAKVTSGHADAAACADAAPTAADTASYGPADRLERIRCLIEAGEEAAARREIARLEKAFPRQSIPADLRERAGADTE